MSDDEEASRADVAKQSSILGASDFDPRSPVKELHRVLSDQPRGKPTKKRGFRSLSPFRKIIGKRKPKAVEVPDRTEQDDVARNDVAKFARVLGSSEFDPRSPSHKYSGLLPHVPETMETLSLNPSDVSAKTCEMREEFESCNQGHLLDAVDSLVRKGQMGDANSLLAQLRAMDVCAVVKEYARARLSAAASSVDGKSVIRPLPSLPDSASRAESLERGFALVRRSRVALCLLAGGQGSRLGFDGPKGCFVLPGLPSEKSLFQLHCERVLRLERIAKARKSLFVSEQVMEGSETSFHIPTDLDSATRSTTEVRMDFECEIPIFVMTSPQNDSQTRIFFKQHSFFGLKPSQVHFFVQSELACFDAETDKILLSDARTVATSPDGNGGMFPSLKKSGGLDMLKNLRIEYLHVIAVDNAAALPCEPWFLGRCSLERAQVGNKCVDKLDPNEKVGVAALRDGKHHIVEYSEISETQALQLNEDGKLAFGLASICNHVFSIDFLCETACPSFDSDATLRHLANKRVSYYDGAGQIVQPTKPNAYKLECFIFDVFKLASAVTVVRVDRATEFAPVKNAVGKDSPETALEALSNLHKSILTEAGCGLIGRGVCELSPLVAYSFADCECALSGGLSLQLPCRVDAVYERQLSDSPFRYRVSPRVFLNFSDDDDHSCNAFEVLIPGRFNHNSPEQKRHNTLAPPNSQVSWPIPTKDDVSPLATSPHVEMFESTTAAANNNLRQAHSHGSSSVNSYAGARSVAAPPNSEATAYMGRSSPSMSASSPGTMWYKKHTGSPAEVYYDARGNDLAAPRAPPPSAAGDFAPRSSAEITPTYVPRAPPPSAAGDFVSATGDFASAAPRAPPPSAAGDFFFPPRAAAAAARPSAPPPSAAGEFSEFGDFPITDDHMSFASDFNYIGKSGGFVAPPAAPSRFGDYTYGGWASPMSRSGNQTPRSFSGSISQAPSVYNDASVYGGVMRGGGGGAAARASPLSRGHSRKKGLSRKSRSSPHPSRAPPPSSRIPAVDDVVETLKRLDVNNTTPMEALKLLAALKARAMQP